MPDSLKQRLPARIEQRISMQLEVAQRMRSIPTPLPAAPFLTISRQYGCGAIELAEALTARLNEQERLGEIGWQVYSRRIMEDISAEVKLSSHVLEALDARARSGLEEFFETLVGQSPPDIKVLRVLVQTLRALALHGRCVLVGRGGAVLTRDLPHGIHIRLVAPENWRLQNLINRFGWDERRARGLLHEEESARHGFYRKYLGKDPQEAANYDLMINVTHVTRDEQVDAILAVYRRRFLT